VEILQVEGVVPNLIDGSPIECAFAGFELDSEDDWAYQQYSINTPAHAGDVVFEEEGALEAGKARLKQCDLGTQALV